MLSAFAFGGTLFWVLMAIFFIIEVASVFCENGAWSTITIALMIGTVQLSGFDLIGLFLHHPLYGLGAAGAYIIAGILWMFVKWWFYSNKVASAINMQFIRWKENTKFPVGTTGKYSDFVSSSAYRAILEKFGISQYSENPLSPTEKTNYNRLIYWVSYWPLSFILTMLNDPIVYVTKFIVERCGGLLSKISSRAMSKIQIS